MGRELVTLPGLAREIKLECLKAHEASRSAVIHAINAGKLLIQAKDTVRHGEWEKWVKEQTGIAPTTAALYMRLALGEKVLLAKTTTGVDLTLNGASRLLEKPRKKGKKKEGQFADRLKALKTAYIDADGETRREFLDWVNDDDDRRKDFLDQFQKVFG